MCVSGQSHAQAALPPGKGPSTHCIGGYVGYRVGLDRREKSRPHRNSKPGGPAKVETKLQLMLCNLH